MDSLDLSYCTFKLSKGVEKIDFDYLGEKCEKLRQFNLIRSKPKTKFTSPEAVMLGDPCFRNLELLNMAFGTVIMDHVIQPASCELIWLMTRYVPKKSLYKLTMKPFN